MTSGSYAAGRQRGAALVIGLVLLLVLTLLAVSSMNSASLEYIMAGNEQFHANAFEAAETGIAQSLNQGLYNPGAPQQVLAGNNTPSDAWTSSVAPQLGGAPLPAIWGYSWNSFSTYHFEIQASGTSVRGAQSQLMQGVAVISPFDPAVQPDPLAASNQLN